ncbi:MucBP domain-containing protein [Vagococcus entomophilus]|uniref:Gram-positive cocci surface proteins LPxTG domain-containing protein n=1 Tax=Vagococcus entomophilus TaxID=1160095 RepID=A0A430AGD1_9ENTE|nr:MucBP domain-containing protein [Vagococcus entomophilus]RSU06951.1 hypothetical protein CBF30_06735 [Vagococcus entomophilus]
MKKKNYLKFIVMACVVSIFFLSGGSKKVLAENTDGWVESATNPDLKITSGDYEVHYTYGINTQVGWNSAAVFTGYPNVYLVDKKANKVVQHQFGFFYNGDSSSSSSFLLGLKDSAGAYHVYSSPFSGAKIYTKDGVIKSVVEKTIDGYGKFQYENYLTPVGTDTVNHKYVITNTGNQVMIFRAMKNVDTDLDGNDKVPVYMLGQNEGLYIKSGSYRLNYFMSGSSGPKNFKNFYKPYHSPATDTMNANVYYPYTPEDITGVGDESKGYASDAAVAGTGDTGIYMKWDEVTLQPGESKEFSYDVSLSGNIKSERSYENQTQQSGINYPGDTLAYRMTAKLDSSFGEVSSGTITDTLDKGLSFTSDKVEILDASGTVLRSVPVSDCYDAAKHKLSVPIQKSDVQSENVTIRYFVKADQSLANQTAHNEGIYQIIGAVGEKNITDSLDVPFSQKKSQAVTVSYLDESGNVLPLDDGTANPLILTGEYGAKYETQEKPIKGYILLRTKGDTKGTFTDVAQTVQYVYGKDPNYKGNVITKYIDKDTKTDIVKQTVETKPVGDSYTTQERKIKGYTLVEKPSNATGKVGEGDTVVTYLYVKNPTPQPASNGIVRTYYIDESGKEIATKNQTSGEIGTDYTTIKKNITGYTFKEVQGSASGKYTKGEITVRYSYKKTPSTPTPSSSEGKQSNKHSNNLPQTGEQSKSLLSKVGAVLLIIVALAIGFIYKNKK